MECGDVLPNVEIAYETYGEIDEAGTNAVLVCHALTGNSSSNEWWKTVVGEGKALDPSKYFIITPNCIGSCYGSTGPESINPATSEPYHSDFPQITIRDIALSLLTLLDTLGIKTLSLAIGGSFGAMIIFEIALLAPERVHRIIPISCGVEHSAWRIAFSSTIRKIIGEGIATGNGERAFALARQVAMTTYRSPIEFEERFARKKENNVYEIENYLEHHGKKIVGRFSPYSYITLTRAMENYSIFEGREGKKNEILSRIKAQALLVGASTDILYSEAELREIAEQLPKGKYETLHASWGHDSFLIEDNTLNKMITQFLRETEDKQ